MAANHRSPANRSGLLVREWLSIMRSPELDGPDLTAADAHMMTSLDGGERYLVSVLYGAQARRCNPMETDTLPPLPLK